ncbi:MAG: DUF362 domain-containing protein [Clostridia bacterium]|nr:DUF362 domain-containing protein [Clostridia bacterium]
MSSLYYKKEDAVAVAKMTEYTLPGARLALESVLESIGGLDFIKRGDRVVIKANLVSAMKPEESATTHPTLLCALCDMLVERGADVVVGDSPGGLYNAAYVGRVYSVSGVREVTAHGARLNDDYSQREASFDSAEVLHSFTYTGYLDNADYIINFCKLKSHGMMGMSCAAKNMFGAVPGVIKPEYHFRFPEYEQFANMIVDLDEYFHPVISIADAVVGMEGNGPTAGTPRAIGCVLASRSPHNLDMIAAKILGFERSELPILEAAYKRDMVYGTAEEINLVGDIGPLILKDFERVIERRSLKFSGDGKSGVKRAFSAFASSILTTKPKLSEKLCVGCGICRDICPAKAIEIKNKKAKINRRSCIRCFCCQEFCPKSAMKVYRTPIAKLFHGEKK